MSSDTDSASPRSDDISYDRAVDYLKASTGVPREYIRELLLAEVTRLGTTATITRYVHVLAASNIRTRLRHAHRSVSSF